MRHLRSDYDCIQPWPVRRPHYGVGQISGEKQLFPPDLDEKWVEPIIADEEPVFLLRGKDPAAAEAVHEWARQAAIRGADSALVERVHEWADEMTAYALEHGKRCPDVPEGSLR